MRRIVLLICLLTICQGCVGGSARFRASQAEETSTRSQWQLVATEAITALELGAHNRAIEKSSLLAEIRPGNPLPLYLRARVKENEGDWVSALFCYETILISNEIECSGDWLRLVSGRWVRARRRYEESHVKKTLASIDTVSHHSGRCLVLPLEPMLFGDDHTEEAELELEVLGVAIAAWVNAGLQLIGGADPIGLHSTYYLREALAEMDGYSGIVPVGDPFASGFIPPVTTILGIATRLARLSPAGPPPWDPEAAPSPHYLNAVPDSNWDDRKARALAYFQAENDLPSSGIVDPLTRRKLESVFRSPQEENQKRELRKSWTDISARMGQSLGAEAVLSGTLEKSGAGNIRWNVAWVSPYSGQLLSDPLEGHLPFPLFEQAWERMISLIIQASPPCRNSTRCGRTDLPEAPGPEGARDYGYALLLIEEENPVEAVEYFKQSASKGVGDRATWYAMAWEPSRTTLANMERDFYEHAANGPSLLDPGFLRSRGLALSGGLMRNTGGERSPATESSGTTRSTYSGMSSGGVNFLPETAWISVSGSVEE